MLSSETSGFNSENLEKTTRLSRNNKTSSLNGALNKVWKVDCLKEELLIICNGTYHGDASSAWLSGVIILTPKKGILGLTAKFYRHHTNCNCSKILPQNVA